MTAFHEGRIRIPYKWPAGNVGSAFLEALADRRLLGSRCPRCATVYAPPRSICLQCHVAIDELSEVGPHGTVVASAAGFGLIRLDGARTALVHRTDAPLGARVHPVWSPAPQKSILDVVSFAATGETGDVEYGITPPPPRKLTLPQPVTVLGTACTPRGADRSGWSIPEMVHEVVSDLFARTGFKQRMVDTVITASSDFLDGRTISDMAVQDVVGAPGKSASKVSMDGLFALPYAVARLTSGVFNTCLVVAHAKASSADQRAISRAAFDPILIRPLGVTDHDVLRLQASRMGIADPSIVADGDGAVAILLTTGAGPVSLSEATFATLAHSPGDWDVAAAPGLSPMGPSDATAFMDLSSAQTALWERVLGPGTSLSHQWGFATGLERLATVHEALSKTPGTGLAHAVAGYVGQSQAVWRLRSQ